MDAKFKRLSREVRTFLLVDDELGLKPRMRPVIHQQTYAFETSTKKLSAFNDWLKGRVDEGVLTTDNLNQPWTSEYVDSAYKKGMSNAYTQVHKVELAENLDFYQGTKEQFLRSAFWAPTTTDKLRMLYTRTFEELKGVTASMSQQMSRILADGLAQGLHPLTIAREMDKAILKIDRTRARMIARTEVIRAHAEGQLDSFEKLGVKEVGIKAEWSTAEDELVCPECDAMSGKAYAVDEASGLIPLHPNCRCAWVPLTPEAARDEKESMASVAGDIRSEMYNSIDSGDVKTAEELYDKFGQLKHTNYYLWDKAKADEFRRLIDTSQVKSVKLQAYLSDLKSGTISKHSFAKVGKNYIDPKLRAAKMLQKEINQLNEYLASVYQKAGMEIIGPSKKVIAEKVTKVVEKKMAKAVKDVMKQVKAGETKFATAEEYRKAVIEAVEGAKTAEQEAIIQGLIKEVNAIEKEIAKLTEAKYEIVKKYGTDSLAYKDTAQKIRTRQTNLWNVDNKLKEARKTGKVSKAAQRKLLNEIDNVAGLYDDWVDMEREFKDVANDILSWIPRNNVSTREMNNLEWLSTYKSVRSRGGGLLGEYYPHNHQLYVYGNYSQTFAHEFGHHLNHNLKGFLRAEKQFFNARTAGERKGVLPGFSTITGKKDKWNKLSYYAGRIYNSPGGEVTSVGLEWLWKNPYYVARKDPEWFNFLVSHLKGIAVE